MILIKLQLLVIKSGDDSLLVWNVRMEESDEIAKSNSMTESMDIERFSLDYVQKQREELLHCLFRVQGMSHKGVPQAVAP